MVNMNKVYSWTHVTLEVSFSNFLFLVRALIKALPIQYDSDTFQNLNAGASLHESLFLLHNS